MEKYFAPKIESLKNQKISDKNPIEQKSTPLQDEIIELNEEVADPRKRAFLLGMAAMFGTALASKTEPGIKLLNIFQRFLQQKKLEVAEDEIEDDEESEDGASISEIINYDQPGEIVFDIETYASLKNYWKDSYKENPNLKDSLDGALKRISPFETQLKKIFKQEGIPEHLAYLAIPESHFMVNAHSKKNAVGPYQFTEDTAKKYKLKVSKNNDERKDPIKSGHACARLLNDLFKVSKDWNIALSAYNGGFAWAYLNKSYKQKESISYEGFLQHFSVMANKIRNEIKNNPYLSHTIKRNDNFGKIAAKYGVKSHDLMTYNNLNEKSIIREGKTLKIPLTDENKRNIFNKKISGLIENITYAAKCNAIFERIEEINKA